MSTNNLQDRSELDRHAALGVAVREFSLSGGFCDYLLFVGGKAAGAIEAKSAGVRLSGVADQAVAGASGKTGLIEEDVLKRMWKRGDV